MVVCDGCGATFEDTTNWQLHPDTEAAKAGWEVNVYSGRGCISHYCPSCRARREASEFVVEDGGEVRFNSSLFPVLSGLASEEVFRVEVENGQLSIATGHDSMAADMSLDRMRQLARELERFAGIWDEKGERDDG